MAAGDHGDLEKNLIRQVEFYFGDYNLHRDKFMQEEMAKNDGWFSMDTMLKFQRLSSICSEPGTILAALKKSKSNLMEIDVDGQKIRRKLNRPLPENDAKYKRDLKLRSVYVKGFPQTETIENITEFLSDYGQVDGIQLRRTNNPHQGSVFKGSLFATFAKLEDAEKFLQAPMVYYKDKELEKMSKDAFWKEKEAENVDRPKKGQKKKDSKEEPVEEKDEDNFSFLQVSNLTDTTISHIDIKELLREIGANECKFFSRYEKNGPTGYMLFPESSAAEEALALLSAKKGGCTLSIKSSEEVTFEILSDEDSQKALHSYEEFRNQMKPGKKRKKFGGKKRQHGRHTKFEEENGNGHNGEPTTKQAKVDE
ncbi:lupus La protein homolog [Clavelina lepadiformis]|uniref:Lupus La protein n=1 Tax=Clavelina lepadiformis TaxID=159417 RepID=A0ABP0GYA7_CLALP